MVDSVPGSTRGQPCVISAKLSTQRIHGQESERQRDSELADREQGLVVYQ